MGVEGPQATWYIIFLSLVAPAKGKDLDGLHCTVEQWTLYHGLGGKCMHDVDPEGPVSWPRENDLLLLLLLLPMQL